MAIRKRQRINENLDIELLDELDFISKELDFPKSRILEVGIKYILKKQPVATEKKKTRKPINLTINKSLWDDFKLYAESNDYKFVYLLEAALKYSIKKFKKEIHK
jgi:hypothetical protein